MKNITEFILENSTNESQILFESLNSNMTLTECFEAIGDAMLRIDEGFFSKVGSKLAAWGKSAAEAGEKADKKIEKLSGDVKQAAETAIATTKKKAGAAWDKVKDAYTNIVADVATGIESAKDAIEGVAKMTGKKVSEVTSQVAQVVSNGIAKGNEAIKNAIKTPIKMAAIATLIGAAASCQKHGIDVLDVLVSAGIE